MGALEPQPCDPDVEHRSDPNDRDPTVAPRAIHRSGLEETDHGSWLTEVVQPVREM